MTKRFTINAMSNTDRGVSLRLVAEDGDAVSFVVTPTFARGLSLGDEIDLTLAPSANP